MKQKLKKYSLIGFLLGVLFLGASIQQADAAKKNSNASFFISPATGAFKLGKTFSLTVNVSSKAQAMNAASGVIRFPKDKIEVVSISKKNKSIINLWVQEPSFSNEEGKIRFEGIVYNPGFQGASGKILTVKFKAKASGDATVKLSSGTVLANDGQGTNILTKLGSAKFNIPSPATPALVKSVSSPLPPVQNEIVPIQPPLQETKLRASPKSRQPFIIPEAASTLQILTQGASSRGAVLFAAIFFLVVVVFAMWRRYRLK